MSIFDTVIDRSNTGALKLDVLKERYGREDLLALWVAAGGEGHYGDDNQKVCLFHGLMNSVGVGVDEIGPLLFGRLVALGLGHQLAAQVGQGVCELHVAGVGHGQRIGGV